VLLWQMPDSLRSRKQPLYSYSERFVPDVLLRRIRSGSAPAHICKWGPQYSGHSAVLTFQARGKWAACRSACAAANTRALLLTSSLETLLRFFTDPSEATNSAHGEWGECRLIEAVANAMCRRPAETVQELFHSAATRRHDRGGRAYTRGFGYARFGAAYSDAQQENRITRAPDAFAP